jgi:hypothetical protein
MKSFIATVVLMLSMCSAFAEQVATVTAWKVGTYSQSANITRNRIEYSIDVEDKHYVIARRGENTKPEFQKGDTLQVRFDRGKCYVLKPSGKGEEKFEVIAEQ